MKERRNETVLREKMNIHLPEIIATESTTSPAQQILHMHRYVPRYSSTVTMWHTITGTGAPCSCCLPSWWDSHHPLCSPLSGWSFISSPFPPVIPIVPNSSNDDQGHCNSSLLGVCLACQKPASQYFPASRTAGQQQASGQGIPLICCSVDRIKEVKLKIKIIPTYTTAFCPRAGEGGMFQIQSTWRKE